MIRVYEKFRQIKEFWDELFDIGHVVLRGRKPSFFYAVEHSISQIEMSTLDLEKKMFKYF